MNVTLFITSDITLVGCCLLVTALALVRRHHGGRSGRVAVIAAACVLIAALNLLFDAGVYVPVPAALPLMIYLSGGSKGVLMGWLSNLLLFKQLPTESMALSGVS